MIYALTMVIGVFAGALCVFLVFETKRTALQEQRRRQEDQARKIAETLTEIERSKARIREDNERLNAERAEFEKVAVSYRELQNENTILKRDLQNVDVNLRKLQLDRQKQRETQEELDRRSAELGARYLKENVKWIGASLTPNNFVSSKERLQRVVQSCRNIGFDIPTDQEASLLDDLRAHYDKTVRAAFEREEQARIKAQIREEQRLEKEIERELKQLEREREAIRVALEKALADAKDEHSAEVERLRTRLAEAEEKSQRAISRAQMTKSGHVYVISNVGSFGEGVLKIGMTRRLEPMDRVKELGDASVPFPFDVHMMISSNDAPTLENALHRALHRTRLNRVNPRKEFFRTDVQTVNQIVKHNHGEVEYIADPEALEYRQSLQISDEDQDFIESTYERLSDANGIAGVEHE